MCYCPLHFVRAVCEHAKDTNKESQINIHYTTTAKLKQTNKQKKSNNKTLSWRLASFQLLCLLFRILFHLLSLLSHNATRPKNLRAADDTRCILAASGSVFYFFYDGTMGFFLLEPQIEAHRFLMSVMQMP